MLRKISFLIAFCLALLPIYAQTSSGGGGLAYAYNQTSGNLECFSLDGFTSFQTLHTIGDDVRAGAFVEGEYYALRYENSYPVEIAAYDLATGNKRSVMPTTTVYRDMAYDYSTQTLLLLEYNPDLSTNSLMRLDLESGEITKVCDFEYNMARVGVGIYGLQPDLPEGVKKPVLKPAMSLRGRITNIHTAPAGEGVSYSHTFETTKPTKIATIPIGYADGVFRGLSNKIYGIVNGKKVKQIGNITMDQMMFDITDCKANEGDTITLLGTDGNESIQIDEWAKILNTIHYELVCALRVRLPRVYTR